MGTALAAAGELERISLAPAVCMGAALVATSLLETTLVGACLLGSSPGCSRLAWEQPWWQQGGLGRAQVAAGRARNSPGWSRDG